MLHAEQRAENIRVEGGGIAVGCLLGHRAGLAFSAGIVDGGVQAAEACECPIDEIAYFVLMAYVGADELGLGAERTQLGRELLAGILAAAGDDEASAFIC